MKLKTFYKRFVSQVVQLHPRAFSGYISYLRQRKAYRALGGTIHTSWPILGEDTPTTDIDPHYFYQGAWVAHHIAHEKPERHVDVGSQTNLSAFLAALTPTTFVDLRPLEVTIPGLSIMRGSVLELPFPADSVPSLSCLHVAEHIGLGRYGDPLDPDGTRKACTELARVLAPGGTLYFSLPIGHERTEFNAHRVHLPSTILRYFSELALVEFSAVGDDKHFVRNADPNAYREARYACGFFRFSKKAAN